MKTVVIYHRADFDGIFCREIARKFFGETAEYIGWDYGDAVPEVSMNAMLVMLDISIEALMEHPHLIWIDHHKSAIEKYCSIGWVHEPAGKDSFGVPYNEFWRRGHETRTTEPFHIGGYRIDGVAACRLAWQYFQFQNGRSGPLPEKQAYINRTVSEPLAVRLAGEYDIWDKRDPNAELFQHGLRSQSLDALWQTLLDGSRTSEVLVNSLLACGESIQYVQTQQNESIIKAYGFTVKFEGLTFLACNHARFNSHLFTAGIRPEHDALMGFNFDGPNKTWRFSLYGIPGKDIDLSVIAVKFGGGGHRGACGFRSDELPFLNSSLLTKIENARVALVDRQNIDAAVKILTSK